MKYVISDTHFGHGNLIEYCNRPFDDTGEMNGEMVVRWQNTVNSADTVIHLGDARHPPDPYTAESWMDALDGQIVLVRGNHDEGVTPNGTLHVFESVTIRHGRWSFYMEHAPINGFGGWQIHGHVHNNDVENYPFINYENKTINVSVELIDYRPVALDEIIHHMEKEQTFRDIHEAREESNVYPTD